MKRLLSQVAKLSGGSLSGPWPDIPLTGVAVNPKSVQAGWLYVPLEDSDSRTDGHEYAAEAIKRGAAAMLWRSGHPLDMPRNIPVILVNHTEEALVRLATLYRKELPVRTIAVTGSDGKTTTKEMVAAIMATTYKVHESDALSRPLTDLACSVLQMDEDTEMAVFELSWSKEADIGLQSNLLEPEAAIITNVGENHLLQLGTRREIAFAKGKIAAGMKAEALLVYNGEEPLLEEALRYVRKPEGLRTYRFGSSESNDMFPIAMLNEPDGTSFKINLPATSYYRIPFLGLHNIMNAMAAAAVSKYMGVHDQDVAHGLRHMERSFARLIPVHTRSGAVILNDSFSASPTSMKAAIELLKDLPGYTRKIVVLGDMVELGPEEIRFHKEIGALLSPPEIYKVFAFGTLAKYIASEAGKGMPGGRVRWFQEKAELIDAVAAEATQGDAILIKGSRMMGLDELVDILTGV